MLFSPPDFKWTRIVGLDEAVAVAHHSFPCTASMDVDPQIGEPILHVAGYAIREAVREAVEKSLKGKIGR